MVNNAKLGFFTGEYSHSLTEKNRVALPKVFRVEIDSGEVILSKGSEQCIEGFDRKMWQELVKIHLAIPFTESRGREIRRRVFSSAMPVQLDGQGRVVLPEQMLVYAGLKGKVGEQLVIVGVGDHFEIWEESRWKQKISQPES